LALISIRILDGEVRNLSVDCTAYSGFVPTPPNRSGVQGSAHRVAVRWGNLTRPLSSRRAKACNRCSSRSRSHHTRCPNRLPSARLPASQEGENKMDRPYSLVLGKPSQLVPRLQGMADQGQGTTHDDAHSNSKHPLLAQGNETVETGETGETLFFISDVIKLLGCGFSSQIPRKSKKCLI
jgi:hypothetical protein